MSVKGRPPLVLLVTMASEVVLALPHKLRVMRMYRTGLKELINWSSHRLEWYPRVSCAGVENNVCN